MAGTGSPPHRTPESPPSIGTRPARQQVVGAVTFVVVDQRLCSPSFELQRRPRAFKRLYLGLLVEGEDHRALGRVEVEANDIDQRGRESVSRESFKVSTHQGRKPCAARPAAPSRA